MQHASNFSLFRLHYKDIWRERNKILSIPVQARSRPHWLQWNSWDHVVWFLVFVIILGQFRHRHRDIGHLIHVHDRLVLCFVDSAVVNGDGGGCSHQVVQLPSSPPSVFPRGVLGADDVLAVADRLKMVVFRVLPVVTC